MAIQVDIAGATPVMFKKDYDRAVASLEKITGSARSDSDAAVVLAKLMMQNGRYDRAVELWGKILKAGDRKSVV